jgi:hypothetical protein
MAALDRLVWAAGLSISAFGVRVGLRFNSADDLPRIRACLPPGHRLSTDPVVDRLYSLRLPRGEARCGVRHFYLVYSGSGLVARTLDANEAFEALESAVRFDVACSSTDFTFVHAGVVGVGGRAIVIPGPSMHGKSRLVEALVRAGAEYYSDEFAVFDRDGRVHPFPKALSIRQPFGPCRRVTAEELGGRRGSRPLRVALVVSCPYREGASWQPTAATPGEAALLLLANAVRARLAPADVLRTLARVVDGTATLIGTRGEAELAVGPLLSAIDLTRPAPTPGGKARNQRAERHPPAS